MKGKLLVILIWLSLLIGGLQGQGSIGKSLPAEEALLLKWELDLGNLPLNVRDTFLYYYRLMHPLQKIDLDGNYLKVNYMPSVNDHVCNHDVKGCNQACKWVEWYRWKYRTKLFENAEAAKKHKHFYLQMNEWEGAGLEVFINGTLVEEPFQPLHSSFANKYMDLDPYLRRNGTDSLVLQFQAVTPYAKQFGVASGLVFPADNEGTLTEMKASPNIRKPIVQYGWDIAPRRVLTGLGEGVKMIGWDDIWIQLFQMYQERIEGDLQQNKVVAYSVDAGKSVVVEGGELKVDGAIKGLVGKGKARWIYLVDKDFADLVKWEHVSVGGKSDNLVWDSSTLVVNPYFQNDAAGVVHCMATESFAVKDLLLWQPNVIREHHIMPMDFDNNSAYVGNIVAKFRGAGEPEERSVKQFARVYFREVLWDTSSCGFGFSVNGKKVFAKGVNVVWARLFQPGSPYPGKSDVDAWIASWVKLGVNMVRIWGGGAYPSDYFYEQCDAFGIMVWQDFMFSGTTYPRDMLFLNAVEIEVHNVVNRLFHHPSLVMWCGNNEIEVAWFNWGWQNKYGIHGQDSIAQWNNYLFMFDTLIPFVLKSYVPNANYLRSSPIGNWGNLKQMRCGDNHDWGVWHGERTFAYLDSVKMPFVSEYGMPSLPKWMQLEESKLLGGMRQNPPMGYSDSFISLLSPYMLSYKGLGLWQKYMQWGRCFLGDDSSFGGLPAVLPVGNRVEESWALQGDFVVESMVQHRLQQPLCAGSLMWQWNDIWPGITWSLTQFDSFALKSPESMAKAFAPVVGKYAFKRVKSKQWVAIVKYESAFLSPRKGKIGFQMPHVRMQRSATLDRELLILPGVNEVVLKLDKKSMADLEEGFHQGLMPVDPVTGLARIYPNYPLFTAKGLIFNY